MFQCSSLTSTFGNMSPKRTYLISVALWAVFCVGHFLLRTHAILMGPRDVDLYAYSWGFQFWMFLFFPFPVWIVALGFALLLEMWYFSSKQKKGIAEQNAPANAG
jgi:hypothetical protein